MLYLPTMVMRMRCDSLCCELCSLRTFFDVQIRASEPCVCISDLTSLASKSRTPRAERKCAIWNGPTQRRCGRFFTNALRRVSSDYKCLHSAGKLFFTSFISAIRILMGFYFAKQMMGVIPSPIFK